MNLAGTTPGNSYKALLTLPTATPVGGVVYRIEWGDGAGTPLYLGNGIVGVGNSASAMSQFVSEATALRSVAIPNQTGRMVIASDLRIVLSADFSHNTNSAVDVTGMLLTLPPGTWAVFATGRLNSNNADNGILLSTSGTATIAGGTFAGDPITSPATAIDFGFTRVVIATVASGAGTVQLRVANEIASRIAILRSGFTMFALRIA
jgi:hypothetical protein